MFWTSQKQLLSIGIEERQVHRATGRQVQVKPLFPSYNVYLQRKARPGTIDQWLLPRLQVTSAWITQRLHRTP